MTRTADLSTAKILWNSTISTPGARYACADIENMYLQTPMDRYEYMQICVDLILDAFKDAYNLWDKIYNGHRYMEIRSGCYGLPQASILANKILKKTLAVDQFNFLLSWTTLGSNTKDDSTQHLDHLIASIKCNYEVTVDYTGSLHCGITLDWNYDNGYLDISMPGYVNKQCIKYNHPPPKKPVNTPWEPYPIKFSNPIQLTLPHDDSPPLNKQQVKRIQQIVGSFLYYSRATDLTITHQCNRKHTQTMPTLP
eukprot:CCRYP_014643-RA/>CCRYP_014643-RA protein AED:0.40 eAED:0.40 QI:0/0/0/1/0/0/2/0/252